MRYQGPWDRFITFIWSHEESRVCRALCAVDTQLSCWGDDISDWWEYWPNQVMVSLLVSGLLFGLAAGLMVYAITA